VPLIKDIAVTRYFIGEINGSFSEKQRSIKPTKLKYSIKVRIYIPHPPKLLLKQLIINGFCSTGCE
jgi:hypothetical protein